VSTDHAELNVSQREALFALLSDAQWHPHYELARVAGVRYGARVLELRRLGFDIETEDCAGSAQGKTYRMPSTIAGPPQPKRVKVLLEETDVLCMVRGYVPPSARIALNDAHASFDTNREKL
jgi:hypothetical protein